MREEYAVGELTDMAESDFWSWSLGRYRQAGVESLSIRLQDEFGLNVNVLLWSCWCGARYEAAPEVVLRKAIDATALWNGRVTARLRGARRHLRAQTNVAGAMALRDDIKAAELAAEKIEQTMLENLAEAALTQSVTHDSAQVLTRARRNLAEYAALVGAARKEGFSTSLLHEFIDRIFEGAPDDAAGQDLSR